MRALVADVVAFGRIPRRRPGLEYEYDLANNLHTARYKEQLSASEIAEIEKLEEATRVFEESDFAERVEERRETLMGMIRALGHLPRFAAGGTAEENALAIQLRQAKRQNLLTASQLEELQELPTKVSVLKARRMEALMDEIRELGHRPRKHATDEKEHELSIRLANAMKDHFLHVAQLAELEELPPGTDITAAEFTETLVRDITAFGRIPRRYAEGKDEDLLAERLARARHRNLLSEAQYEQLLVIARASIQPLE